MTVEVSERRADAIAATARDGARAWSRVDIAGRRAMLEEFAALVERHADEWVRVAARIKGLEPGTSTVGEEWVSGPWATL